MWYLKRLKIYSLFAVYAVSGRADPVMLSEASCINNAREQNQALKKSFSSCWDPLGLDYLAYSAATKKQGITSDFPESLSCSAESIMAQKINLEQLASSLNGEPMAHLRQSASEAENLGFVPAAQVSEHRKSDMIKRECIVASMKRNPGNKGYVCEYPGDRSPRGINPSKQSILKYYGTASGSTAQCVDEQMTDYVYFAANSAIQCMSGIGKIDSKTLFRKINNESAFNISVASGGGVGIGQLTPIAIKEILDPKLGKGRYILDHVANSGEKSCNGFKSVAAHDLKNPPSTSVSNRCAWISPGDGFARNLIYAIGYYLTMRDKYLMPSLLKMAPALAQDEGLLNDLASIAYGAEGIKHAKSLLWKFRVNDKTNIAELRKKIRGNSRYLSNIKSKMKEVTCISKGWHNDSSKCKKYNMTSEELEGDACVAPI